MYRIAICCYDRNNKKRHIIILSDHIDAANRLPFDGEVYYLAGFLDTSRAADLFDQLRSRTKWRQPVWRIFGKTVRSPRLSAWSGNPGITYTYSGLENTATGWDPLLLDLCNQLNEDFSLTFNSVLLNYYESGSSSIGWHSDDEPELGQQPVIASISLGAERRFVLKHRLRKPGIVELGLEHGSLLLMGGMTQHFWKHTVPKTRVPVEARINLTYRQIINT